MNRPPRPITAALLAALAVTGVVATCLAQTPRVSDALRRSADEVDRLERESAALRRENADLKRRQLAQATPAGDVGHRPELPGPARAPAPRADQAAQAPLGITVVAAGTTAPAAVHLCGLSATPAGATPLTARYDWTFADAAGGVVQRSVGWNAAAVFDAPGDYLARLRVTGPDGKSADFERRFAVAPDARHTVVVTADGNDRASGRDEATAVRSLSVAVARAGNDARVLLRRGDTFEIAAGVALGGRDVQIRAFGDPALPLPRLVWTAGPPPAGTAILEIQPSADGLLVENVEFDTAEITPGATGTEKQTVATAIRAGGGTNLVVRGCRFLNVADAFNGNGKPTGVLIRGNVAPLATGLRAYFVWGAGRDYVVERNDVANSTREHVVRLSQIERITITNNRLTNLDRRDAGDPHDTVKGVLTVQLGEYAYVAGNALPSGAVNLGPLGGGVGMDDKAGRWRWAVVEDNRVGQMLEVKNGTEHVAVRGNRLDVSDGTAVEVDGYDATYGRGVADLTIERNTAVNAGKSGNFLRLRGRAEGVRLAGNLYVAPALVTGAYNSAAVYVGSDDLASFAAVGGNVWPTAAPSAYARGGVCFVGSKGSSAGYLTPDAWNALPLVKADGGDRFLPLASADVAPPGVGCDPSALPTPRPASPR